MLHLFASTAYFISSTHKNQLVDIIEVHVAIGLQFCAVKPGLTHISLTGIVSQIVGEQVISPIYTFRIRPRFSYDSLLACVQLRTCERRRNLNVQTVARHVVSISIDGQSTCLYLHNVVSSQTTTALYRPHI